MNILDPIVQNYTMNDIKTDGFIIESSNGLLIIFHDDPETNGDLQI
jgi:hypothetical protein